MLDVRVYIFLYINLGEHAISQIIASHGVNVVRPVRVTLHGTAFSCSCLLFRFRALSRHKATPRQRYKYFRIFPTSWMFNVKSFAVRSRPGKRGFPGLPGTGTGKLSPSSAVRFHRKINPPTRLVFRVLRGVRLEASSPAGAAPSEKINSVIPRTAITGRSLISRFFTDYLLTLLLWRNPNKNRMKNRPDPSRWNCVGALA